MNMKMRDANSQELIYGIKASIHFSMFGILYNEISSGLV
jgi:hypothetical protein